MRQLARRNPAGRCRVVVGSDGSNGTGLTIPWTASPAIPGAVATDLSITSMVFRVDSLRVVGDTGTSATHGAIELQWASGQTPQPTMFSDAPSGLYSKVVIHADGELVDYSWEIDGTVGLDGISQAFAIHDLTAMSINIDSSAMLDPGGSAMLGVTFQMDQVFDGLDFTALDNDDGLLVLDTDDCAMTAFRTNLQQSIVPRRGSDDTTRARRDLRTPRSSRGGMRRAWPRRRSPGA